MIWDVLIVGAGPAGAACAAFCAQAELRVLVLDRAIFPREKVCGDCLNPSCWPVLDRLGVTEAVLALPHSRMEWVEIATIQGETFRYPMDPTERGEIAVKRSLFDVVLANRATELGAEIRYSCGITRLGQQADGVWQVYSGTEAFQARRVVAADGRNSTVARLLGLLPSATRERVGIQTHLPAPPDFGEKVLLQLLPQGYCGAASIGEGSINLCLVGSPGDIPALQEWAATTFKSNSTTEWRTIAPLARDPLPPIGGKTPSGVVLIGDAARVVEPFTGEGIYYAMSSGELAAQFLTDTLNSDEFRQAYTQLYSGRLWVNRLAKLAVLNPAISSSVISALNHAGISNQLLRLLTAKVTAPAVTV